MSDRNRPLLESTTFCTGLWLVAGNAKRSEEHYRSLLPETCRLIRGARLVVFHDDAEVLSLFRDAARMHGVDVVERRVPVGELPAARYSAALLAGCRAMRLDERGAPDLDSLEKGTVHYWREYRESGERAYEQVVTIWMSKILLVADLAAAASASGTPYHAWVDASVARFDHARTGWDFGRRDGAAGVVSHFGNTMRFRGRELPINASFLHADAAAWQRLRDLFVQRLDAALGDDYAHDEETILGLCHDAQPDLFRCIGMPVPAWRRKLARWAARLRRERA